jgi:TP901 family phage tail tape measure protein
VANRTVSVNLVANIGQYVSGVNAAAGATTRLGASATESTRSARSGFDLASKGAVLMGAAVVGGMALAIGKSMEFEKSMSAVGAATMATTSVLGDLREAAMRAGADTQYSATEAANAITEMAKAGVSAKDIMGGGLSGALALAAAGQIDVAEAAGIASTAMTQFSLTGKDLPHVADLLAAGAGKAMGSVDDLGMALNQAGLIASAAGMSIEETTGTLAAFASAGLLGSDAGTSMKTMLQKLQAPSKESAETMSQLGINVYDANGNMLGMAGIAGQLHTRMSGLTQEQRNAALATIFGSDAVRAANVLYKEGARGIEEWTTKVDDQGYAAEQAAKLNDNLAGDLERLGGAFDTLMISMGSGAQGPLRFLVQGFTNLLDGVSSLGAPLSSLAGFIGDNKEVAIALATVLAVQLAGGIGAVTVAFNSMILTPVVLGLSAVLGGAGAVATFLTGGFSAAVSAASTALMGLMATAAPLAAVASIAYAVVQTIDFATAAGDARDEIHDMWGAVEDARGVEQLDALSGVVDQIESKIRSLNQELPKTEGAFQGLLAPLGALENGGTLNALDEYEAALRRAKEQQEQASHTAEVLGRKFHLTGDEVIDLAGKYDIDLTGSLSETRGKFEAFYTAEYGTTPIDAANATGAAMVSAKTLTEEAGKAQEDFIADVAEAMAGFVEPLAAYTGLLEEKKTADREAAEATAASTEDSSDSWKDYITTVTVSFDEYMARLGEQVLAQANWQTNMLQLAGRVSQGTLDELARMGPEGAPLVADLVTRSDAELAHFSELAAQRSDQATGAWAARLTAAQPVLAAIAKTAGQGVVDSLAAQLQAGTTTVAQIMAQYGLTAAGGLNPILKSLGHTEIAFKNGTFNGFNMYEGGYTGDGGKYEPKGIVHGGEYVLTKDQTSRLGIDRIEAFANGYAGGGYVTAADVPKPYSTAPYQMPISTVGDAVMQKEYDVTTAWVTANAGVAGSGSVGGGWQSIASLVQAAIPQARINSTFRPGDPGYHGRGKAVDFGYGSGPGGAGSAGLASINRFLHDGYGSSLAELIYDGIGDDRPDLKNGKPLTYSASTQAEHRNHVHAATYDQGGWLQPGYTMAYNGTGGPERVLTGREFSGAGGGGGGTSPAEISRLAAEIAHILSSKPTVGTIVTQRNETGPELAERLAFMARTA